MGLQLASGAKYEQEAAESFASDLEVFGLSAAAVPDCNVLLAIENGSGGEKAYLPAHSGNLRFRNAGQAHGLDKSLDLAR